MSNELIRWTSSPANALQADAALLHAWDRLNFARLDIPFLAGAAIVAALSAFGSGKERVFVGLQGTHIVAMFILVPQGRWRWATFQPSQIPLGAWVAEPALDFGTLTRNLIKRSLGACLALSITQLDPLIESRAADTSSTQHSDYIETGWIDIKGSFANYWAERGKNLRQNLRKQRNKLIADAVHVQMRTLTAPHEMSPALARYGELESSGWKAGQGTSIHPNNAQGRFYTQLLVDAATRGEAVIYEYLFNERTVAMNLCLLRAGVLFVLKTTYDESIKLFSPASLLREEELQEFFTQGRIRRVEYYGRLMDWHTKLTDRKRTLHHVTVYRWPILKKLAEIRRVSIARSDPDQASITASEIASQSS